MTRAQEIRIALLKSNGWRRYSWAILPGRLERLPLLFHPTGDFKFASVEADGRFHLHVKRTALAREFEQWIPKAIGVSVETGEPVFWDGQRIVGNVRSVV